VSSRFPALLGGADTLMIGRVLWDEFFISRDWPVASAGLDRAAAAARRADHVVPARAEP
jgi:hypothetical protein